ncbi:uncharacterized protein BDZ99DRAFT_486488 [Mytilinidion resinicola]|uniref:DUF1711-domain-containing protein n=1 Tax=Mytilinidion resinicola TaxID=574789 RepID=A0A6A6YYR7_9PEZI|nr:uncharacterized protein BDZ99DRAFT_486488 [Mytilinidion resinicola]KAF2813144.1 hypothetical protein BDZ99DRAFT_486488 [Mytilinidion resinicola]
MAARPTKSLIVKLTLSADKLSKFPASPELTRKDSTSRKPSSTSTSTPTATANEPSSSENPSESNATPLLPNSTTASSSLAPPTTGVKRKGVPGPKPGSKRGAANLTPDGLPKPRGKPGPKKKPRLGDLINDPLAKGAFAAPAPIQKLGPKANQGAINAGLRALDRTGKPCRKWGKKTFAIKSFTGVTWTVPTWRAPKRPAVDFNGDVKSDTTASSDTKMKDESSAISEKSNSGGDSSTPVPLNANILASSPVPAVVVS